MPIFLSIINWLPVGTCEIQSRDSCRVCFQTVALCMRNFLSISDISNFNSCTFRFPFTWPIFHQVVECLLEYCSLNDFYCCLLSDTTVNDVITSCIAGAIRKYLQDTGLQDPEDIPITMTYNSRSVSKKTVECIPLGNHSGATFLKLPVSVADPEKRLHITKTRIDNMKKSSDPHLFSFIYSFVLGNLPESVSRLSLSFLNKHCSLVFSNVPGPIEPIHVNGNEIESIMVTPPLAFDLGVSIAVITYAGSLRLTVLSDVRVIGDPAKVTQAFEEEIYDLDQRMSKKD